MARVERSDNVLGGEPRLAGTRIGVFDIHALVTGGAYPPDDVADELDLSLAQVYAALAYYYDHPSEMRELRQDRANVESRLADLAIKPP